MPLEQRLVEWGKAFSYAVGASHSNKPGLSPHDVYTLVDQAKVQSGILEDGRDASWLSDPSVANALYFAAFFNGDKKRKNKPDMLSYVHEIRSAHEAVHDPDLRQIYNPNYVGFILATHDLIEHDNDIIEKMQKGKVAVPKGFECPKPDRAISFVANQLWVGSAWLRPQIEQHCREFTDCYGLHKEDRMREQIERNGDPKKTSLLTRRGRVIEKIDSIVDDAYHTPHLPAEQCFKAAMLAVTKYDVLLAIKKLGELPRPIEDKYTNAMVKLVRTAKAGNTKKSMRPIMDIYNQHRSVNDNLPKIAA